MNKKTVLPRLRFPEFRDSGEWSYNEIGSIGVVVTGKTPDTDDESLWNGDIQFVTPTDISESKYQYVTQRSVVNKTKIKVLPKNSILFTCIASVGKMAITVHPCITNQQINALIPHNSYSNEYIYYALLKKSNVIKSKLANTTLPIINKTEFTKFTLGIPKDHKEQQKIADCLSSIDELIVAEGKKLALLKTHKKSLMQKLFPAEGKTVPKVRFKGYTDAWVKRKLGEVADVIDGDRGKNYPSEDDLQEQGHTLFLSATNVTKNGFSFESNQYITKEKTESLGNGKLRLNDIVLTSRGSIGHIAWYCKEIYQKAPFLRINSGMLLLRSREKTAPNFIEQFLKSPMGRKQIELISFGSAQPQLTKKDITNYDISLPSSSEQTVIGNFFCNLDEVITTQTEKIETLKLHKKGLMQGLFPSAQEVFG